AQIQPGDLLLSRISPLSEKKLQRQLILPFRIDGRRYDSHAGIPDSGVRDAEVGMIHQIERLGPELDAKAFGKMEVAHEGQVYIHKTGAAQYAPARITKTDAVGDNEGRRVEPMGARALVRGQISICNPVGPG